MNMRLVPNNKWWQFNIHSNKHELEALKFIDTVTEERASNEFKRAVDPPREMKTILEMRDNSSEEKYDRTSKPN